MSLISNTWLSNVWRSSLLIACLCTILPQRSLGHEHLHTSEPPATIDYPAGVLWRINLQTQTLTPVTEDERVREIAHQVHDLLHGHEHERSLRTKQGWIHLIPAILHKIISAVPSPRFLKTAYRLKHTPNQILKQDIAPAITSAIGSSCLRFHTVPKR